MLLTAALMSVLPEPAEGVSSLAVRMVGGVTLTFLTMVYRRSYLAFDRILMFVEGSYESLLGTGVSVLSSLFVTVGQASSDLVAVVGLVVVALVIVDAWTRVKRYWTSRRNALMQTGESPEGNASGSVPLPQDSGAQAPLLGANGYRWLKRARVERSAANLKDAVLISESDRSNLTFEEITEHNYVFSVLAQSSDPTVGSKYYLVKLKKVYEETNDDPVDIRDAITCGCIGYRQSLAATPDRLCKHAAAVLFWILIQRDNRRGMIPRYEPDTFGVQGRIERAYEVVGLTPRPACPPKQKKRTEEPAAERTVPPPRRSSPPRKASPTRKPPTVKPAPRSVPVAETPQTEGGETPTSSQLSAEQRVALKGRLETLQQPRGPERKPNPLPPDSAGYREAEEEEWFELMKTYDYTADNALKFEARPGLGTLRAVLGARQTQKYACYLAGKAAGSIVMTSFTFDLMELMEALIAAQKRGVSVVLVADRSHTLRGATRDQADRLKCLQDAGVRVLVAEGPNIQESYREVGRKVPPGKGIQHSKTLLADHTVIIGSTNWTVSSKSNYECSVVVSLNPAGQVAYDTWSRYVLSGSTELSDEMIHTAAQVRAARRSKSHGTRVIAADDPYRTAKRFSLNRARSLEGRIRT